MAKITVRIKADVLLLPWVCGEEIVNKAIVNLLIPPQVLLILAAAVAIFLVA